MPLVKGDKLGPYEILAPIGAGGMGEVWKARDTRLDRLVAIKTSSARFSERFEREARAIAALNHPNICQIYDVGPDYIVMEFVEGAEIKGPMPLDPALKAAIQLAGALEAAHRKSIIHRDLKPANILTTKSGVKVLDFGLAKFKVLKPNPDDTTQTKALTEEGAIVGTLQYMAPEQLQGKPTDARSDIFSFGCVLYEILSGKRAFRADNQATLIAAIIEREPEPLALNKPLLDRVVRTCLAKDPDDRWQSASDLKRELEWILESGSTAGMPATVLKNRGTHLSWILGWILSGVLTALIAALAIFHFRTAPPPAAAVRFEIPAPEGASWDPGDFPVISPDGSRILFAARKRDGSRSLWMRPMDTLNSQAIPGTESRVVSTGAWSPDGRSIAYAADGKLLRLEIAGGSPQLLGSAAADVWAWSGAGIILYGSTPYPLYQIPASGGDAKPAMDSATQQYAPSFHPDGRSFLFTDPGGGLYIGALDSKEGQRLTDGSSGVFIAPNRVLYVRGSTLLAQSFDSGKQALSGEPTPIADPVSVNFTNVSAFSVSQNGVLAYRRAVPPSPNVLTWYDRHGKQLATVGERGLYSGPALSPDGKRLAIARVDPATNVRDIWVIDLARGGSSRFSFDKADDMNPVWSPDGSRIAFSSNRRGQRDIYWKAAGGAGAEELLLEDVGNKSLEDWSPDGKLLLFNRNNREVDAVPVSGDRKSSPLLKAPFRQLQCRVSPDGHWIAYVSHESGSPEVFVQSFPPGGGKWQITTGGGSEPSWRRDGKELYFMNGSKLEAVGVNASGSSFEAGIAKTLFDVPVESLSRRSRYVPTADGDRFLVVTTPKTLDTTPFVVVQNWQAALKH